MNLKLIAKHPDRLATAPTKFSITKVTKHTRVLVSDIRSDESQLDAYTSAKNLAITLECWFRTHEVRGPTKNIYYMLRNLANRLNPGHKTG